MRDCKLWLGLPPDQSNRPCTASSQVLQDIIKREMHGAPNTTVLSRRYSIMDTSLRVMFQREELRGVTYSRLKILLRGEYEKRWEVLREQDYRENMG